MKTDVTPGKLGTSTDKSRHTDVQCTYTNGIFSKANVPLQINPMKLGQSLISQPDECTR